MKIFWLISSWLVPILSARMTVHQFISRYGLPTGTKYSDLELKILLKEFLLNAEVMQRTLVMTEQQLFESYEQYYPQGNGKNYCKYLYKAFDKDRSGSVEFADWAQILSTIHRGKFNDRASLGFSVYDLNNDGYITEQELYKVVSAYHKLVAVPIDVKTYEKTEITFSHMDKDLDGILIESEFIVGCADDNSIINGLSLFDGFKIDNGTKRKKWHKDLDMRSPLEEPLVKTKVGSSDKKDGDLKQNLKNYGKYQ